MRENRFSKTSRNRETRNRDFSLLEYFFADLLFSLNSTSSQDFFMKRKIRRFLDLPELEKKVSRLDEKVEEYGKRQNAIASELEDLQEEVITEEHLEQKIEQLQEELNHEPEKEDFSPSEKKIISVFLHSDQEWLGSGDLADGLGKSKGTVRKYFSMLKDKIEFEEKKDGRKKMYRLPDDTEEDLLQGREISVSR